MGIPTIRIDGNDVLACYYAVLKARKICIEESRPVLIEAMTYRIGHHSTSDDSSVYRDEKEITWKEMEHPLNRIENLLKKNNMLDEEEEKAYKSMIRKEVIDTVFQNEKLLKPKVKEMFEDVYDTMPPHLVEQLNELKDHTTKYGKHYPQNFQPE